MINLSYNSDIKNMSIADAKYIYYNKPNIIYVKYNDNTLSFKKEYLNVKGKHHNWESIYYRYDGDQNLLTSYGEYYDSFQITEPYNDYSKYRFCHKNVKYMYFICKICNVSGTLCKDINSNFIETLYDENGDVFVETNYKDIPCNEILIKNILM